MAEEQRELSRSGPSAGSARMIGKYRLLAQLGEGGMGVVFRARDPEVGRDVAIKILKTPESALTLEETEHLFKSEAHSLGQLRHPNIVSVFEASFDQSEPYIVMEFINGETLQQKIARSGRLPPHAALGYLGQIAAGLDYAHAQGIIHRDIKSSNIMIDRHGHAFILDFGIADLGQKFTAAAASQGRKLILGTPSSLAPEQLAHRNADHRTDLFALGVIAFECLAGLSPFQGTSVAETVNNIQQGIRQRISPYLSEPSPEAEHFFGKALALIKEDRFDSAHEMISALARGLGVDPASVASLAAERIVIPGSEQKRRLVPLHQVTEASATSTPSDYSNPWRIVAGESTAPALPSRRPSRRYSSSDEWSDDGRRGRAITPTMSPEALIRTAGLVTLLILIPILFFMPKSKSKPAQPARPVAAQPAPAAAPPEAVSENPLADLALADLSLDEPDRDVPLELRDDSALLATLVSPNSSEPEVLRAIELARANRILNLANAAAHLLQYPSHQVREAAAQTLGDLRDRRALPYLMVTLEDGDTIVRSASARAIGRIGEKKALGFLTLKYRSESAPEVRLAMKQAIEELNGFPMEE